MHGRAPSVFAAVTIVLLLPHSGVPQSPPAVVRAVAPPWPERALSSINRGEKVQGAVRIKAGVDPRGQVTSAEVIDGHPLLRSDALQASRDWRFQPQPTAETQFVTVMIAFRLLPADPLTVAAILTAPYSLEVSQWAANLYTDHSIQRTRAPVAKPSVLSCSSDAVLVKAVAPYYPPLALQARIESDVKLRAHLNDEGRVVATTILEGHPLMRIASEQAAGQWQFEPAREPFKLRSADLVFSYRWEPPGTQVEDAVAIEPPCRVTVTREGMRLVANYQSTTHTR